MALSIFLASVVVFLIFVILAICLYQYITNYYFILKYISGSWIDSDGNIIILDITDSGLLSVSFGTQISDEDFEVMSGEYDYTISKVWFKQEYTIHFGKGVEICILPADKAIKFSKKNKTFGVFYSAKLPPK